MKQLFILLILCIAQVTNGQHIQLHQKAEELGKDIIDILKTTQFKGLGKFFINADNLTTMYKENFEKGGDGNWEEQLKQMMGRVKETQQGNIQYFEKFNERFSIDWKNLTYKCSNISEFREIYGQLHANINISVLLNDTIYSVKASRCVFINDRWIVLESISFEPPSMKAIAYNNLLKQLEQYQAKDINSVNDIFVQNARIEKARYYITKEPHMAFDKPHNWGCKLIFKQDGSIRYITYESDYSDGGNENSGVFKQVNANAYIDSNGILPATEDYYGSPDCITREPFCYDKYTITYLKDKDLIKETYIEGEDTTNIEYMPFEDKLTGNYISTIKTDNNTIKSSCEIVPVSKSKMYAFLNGEAFSDMGALVRNGKKTYFMLERKQLYFPIKQAKSGFSFKQAVCYEGLTMSADYLFERIK